MIRFIRFRGHFFWQWENAFGWSVEPVRFIRYLLREQGHGGDAIDDFIASAQPVDATPRIELTRLTHHGKTFGYRVGTWIGQHVASESQVCQFLKSNLFSRDEIA